MNAPRPGFSLVDDEPAPQQQQAQPQPAAPSQGAAIRMLTLALGALAQRTLVALASLFSLATVGSAWWLWWITPSEPSTHELIKLGAYAIFVLAINIIVRRK